MNKLTMLNKICEFCEEPIGDWESSTGMICKKCLEALKKVVLDERNKEMLDKMKPIQTYIDSIVSENYMMNIEVGRYEYILDRADQEMSSECKDKLDSIFSETE